ncbi:MAG: cyclic nucleotide-binding domain-containing protein [Bacteroidota bacterium]
MPVQYITQHSRLKEKDKLEIAGYFKSLDFNNGELLLKESGYAKQLFFIEQGFVRSFYRLENGTEKTHWIYSDDDFVTSWYSFFTLEPSFESLQVLGKTSVYSISITDYKKLYKRNEPFRTYMNGYYQQVIAEMDYLSKTFMHMSAKEKYLFLLETSPNLVREIKLGYLASLLDISQETLSRVRRQI